MEYFYEFVELSSLLGWNVHIFIDEITDKRSFFIDKTLYGEVEDGKDRSTTFSIYETIHFRKMAHEIKSEIYKREKQIEELQALLAVVEKGL